MRGTSTNAALLPSQSKAEMARMRVFLWAQKWNIEDDNINPMGQRRFESTRYNNGISIQSNLGMMHLASSIVF
jgi:hypothetical protein